MPSPSPTLHCTSRDPPAPAYAPICLQKGVGRMMGLRNFTSLKARGAESQCTARLSQMVVVPAALAPSRSSACYPSSQQLRKAASGGPRAAARTLARTHASSASTSTVLAPAQTPVTKVQKGLLYDGVSSGAEQPFGAACLVHWGFGAQSSTGSVACWVSEAAYQRLQA